MDLPAPRSCMESEMDFFPQVNVARNPRSISSPQYDAESLRWVCSPQDNAENLRWVYYP